MDKREEEKAHYYWTINEFTQLVKDYGIENVIADSPELEAELTRYFLVDDLVYHSVGKEN